MFHVHMGMGSLPSHLLPIPVPQNPSISTGVVFWKEGKRRRASLHICRRARPSQSPPSSAAAVAAVAVSASTAAAAAAVVGKCVSSSSLLRSAGVAAVELVALISGFGGGASRVQ